MKRRCNFSKEKEMETKKEEWTEGCGNQHTLPEECEFCEKDENCFYRGMNPDRQYP
jgi:hypothetical protein